MKVAIAAVLAGAILAGGCSALNKSEQVETETAVDLPVHVRGTVGEHAGISGGSALPVEAYGLVIGLGRNGAAEAPPQLQEFFTQYLLRRGMGSTRHGTEEVTPARILRDPDTAVVRVATTIPPGAQVGDELDVQVDSLPQSQLLSLDGGILMPIEMHIAVPNAIYNRVHAKTWAKAKGPLFLNPFRGDADDPSEQAKLRRGRVIGGAKVTRERGISLFLRRPDYALCRTIANRINDRFPVRDKIAVAQTEESIKIVIPSHLRPETEHLLELIMHLPVNARSGALEYKAREIVAAMDSPTAEHERLALVLEAIGRQILPIVRQGYTARTPKAAYWAAVAGLRLGDTKTGGDIVLREAEDSTSPVQIRAVEELGHHPDVPRSYSVLQRLVNSRNELVRIAAYEALLERGDTGIVQRYNVDGQFQLDLVESTGRYIIYATQSETPRIVVFGEGLEVAKPIFFSSYEELVTVNARSRDRHLKVYRKIPRTGKKSATMDTDFSVRDLVRLLGAEPHRAENGEMRGLGLTYGQVVTVLQEMCEGEDIPAKFVLQPPQSVRRIYRDASPVSRPDMPES
ncbi:MAG: flagellar basal body P-ring protein FlgI [Phycisphaerae bacterium]